MRLDPDPDPDPVPIRYAAPHTRIELRAPVLVTTIFAAFLLSCATVPRDPESPTWAEEPLVDHAHRWCADAGHPAGPPPRPFVTDGCSVWPDGDLYWCCVEHDIAYWCGGSRDDRLAADRTLRDCAEVEDPGQADLVYAGVRMGGVPWLPTAWRWGYGHPFGTGYVERAEQPPGVTP